MKIIAPDIGSTPNVGEGLEIPLHNGGTYVYEVTDSQAHKWNNLKGKEKLEQVRKADKEQKDLREYL